LSTTTTATKDAALGAVLGALVGDAAGAPLEFMSPPPTVADAERALTMPGGGVWRVAPGQITDDGELTMCLLRALAAQPTFDLEGIAQAYAAWVRSGPYDIGNTTRMALGCFDQRQWRDLCERDGYAAGMTQAAATLCMGSKSNGSLMRATPLGVWGHRLAATALADYARQDSCLSHPNPSCWQAVAAYAIAIAHLLNHRGDRQGAFAAAVNWANQGADSEVQGWLTDAAQGLDLPYEPQIGFVRIGFTHAFRHLLQGSDYVAALTETLAGGGDTDTNGCIVGGLIGAAVGAEAIPPALRNAVLTCDTALGQPRPQQGPALVDQLLA
jgi:ADP-ribosylglycohydrolase